MSWIGFLKVFTFAVLSGSPGMGDLDYDVVYLDAWRGIVVESSNRLLIDTSVLMWNDERLLVGSIKLETGENMAFLVPTGEEGLITSTWDGLASTWSFPVALWTDGACILIDRQQNQTSTMAAASAPWLVWGLRSSDEVLLTLLHSSEGTNWASDELYFGLIGSDAGLEEEADRLRLTGGRGERDATEIPAELQAHWNEIVIRLNDTRARLERMNSVFSSSSQGIPDAPPENRSKDNERLDPDSLIN